MEKIKKITAVMTMFLCLTMASARGQDAMEIYNLGLKTPLAYKKIEYFTQALQLNPNLVDAYEKRAIYYFFQRRFDNAIEDYTKVAALTSGSADTYLMLGSAYLKKGKGEGIRTELKNLAAHLSKQQRWKNSEPLGKAIENLSRAIELNPQLANAYSYRAEAYRLKGMTALAVRDATTAIRLQGDRRSMAGAYATLSKIYRKAGQDELSEVNFKKSVELDPYSADFPPLHVPLMHSSLGDTSNPKSAGRLGLFGIIAIVFAVIFRLTLPAPIKKSELITKEKQSALPKD